MDLRLEPVTRSNWETAVFLTTDPEGNPRLLEKWLTGNAYSLLESIYDPDWDCRLMMDGETAVGFVFYGYDREENCHLLCRYMIDVKYQRRGYGKAFLPLVVEQMRQQYSCRDVCVCVEEENAHALHLYTAFGFQRTERENEGERLYILKG